MGKSNRRSNKEEGRLWVISNERYCGVQYLGAELFFTRENGEKLRYGYRTECAWKDRILAMKSLDTSTKLENLGKK